MSCCSRPGRTRFVWLALASTRCVLLVALCTLVSDARAQGRSVPPADLSSYVADTSIVIDLPAATRRSALRALEQEIGPEYMGRVLSSADLADGEELLGERSLVLALGARACESVADLAPKRIVVCGLIYRQSFDLVVCPDVCPGVHAILMDQPLRRQATLARLLFPGLRRFSVLLDSSAVDNDAVGIDDDAGVDAITLVPFAPAAPIGVQVADALVGSDALVAVADSRIYNRDTLKSVLLTAYGRDRPVIGFGSSYVRAGALLSAFSTPAHVIRQGVHRLLSLSESQHSARTTTSVRSPINFSVVTNSTVARSLGLSERKRFSKDQTLSDQDLAQ